MSLTFYDPSQNKLIIADAEINGVTRISLKRGNVTTNTIVGTHEAYAARVRANRQPFTLTVSLLQTSPSNIIFEQLLSKTEKSPDSFFGVTLLGNGGTVHINSTGYLKVGADCDLEEEVGERIWTIGVNPFVFGGLIDLLV